MTFCRILSYRLHFFEIALNFSLDVYPFSQEACNCIVKTNKAIKYADG